MKDLVTREQNTNNIEVEGNQGFYNFGQYYRYTSETSQLSKIFTVGEIYPVVGLGVHHISKSVHNMSLYIPLHARKCGKEIERLNVVDIERHFTYVDSETASLERQKLTDELELQAVKIQEEMKLALSAPQEVFQLVMKDNNPNVVEARNKIDTSIPALPTPEQMSANSNEIVMTAKGTSIDVLKRQLMNQQQLGEVVSVYAKEKNNELSTVMSNVASIKSEETKAMVGQAQSMIQSVKDVESKLQQLSLYLGENVCLEVVMDGAESTSKEKINIFSHMLYCDEEMLTHHVFSDGEFDRHDLDHFFDRINDTPEFRNRILPTERCIVVAKPRRTQKIYDECPFVNRFKNAGNFDTFMMVRDGDRVIAIHSPITYQAHAFPTQAEMNDYFATVVDIDDVRLTDAQRNLKVRNDMYMKVAAILQGIVDRQESGGDVVFGELPFHAYSSSFFDPQAIALNVNFINDDDYLLSQNPVLGNVRGWLDQHLTETFGEGEWVYANDDMISYQTAPQAYYQDTHHRYEPQQYWQQNERKYQEIKSIKYRENKPTIKIETLYVHWGKNEDKTRNMNVFVKRPLLSLKAIRPSDLDAIIASRAARQDINEYNIMAGLLQARKDIAVLFNTYKDCIDAVQQLHPALNAEDAYIAVIRYAMSNGLKPCKGIKPTKSVLNDISVIISNLQPIDESAISRLGEALGSQLIGVGTDLTNTYLVVNEEDTLLADLPLIDKRCDQNKGRNVLLGVKRYAIRRDQLIENGFVGKVQMKQMHMQHFFATVPDSQGDIRAATTRQAYWNQNASGAEITQIRSILNSSESNKARLVVLDSSSAMNAAFSGTDEEKLTLIQSLKDRAASSPTYSSMASKSKNVIQPRLSFAGAILLRDNTRYSNRVDVRVVMISFDYFVAIAHLITWLKDTEVRERETASFTTYLHDEFYYKEEFAAENVRERWRHSSYIDCSSAFTSSINWTPCEFKMSTLQEEYRDFIRNIGLELPIVELQS